MQGAFPTETRRCTECEKDFLAAVITLAGIEYMSTTCNPCTERLPSLFVDAKAAPESEEIYEKMLSMGVNVRRHGHMTIDELHQDKASKIGAFCDSVIMAGKWSEAEALWLWGPSGTGKSQGAVAAIRDLLRRGVPSHRIIYDRGRAMAIQLQDRYQTGNVDAFSRARRECLVWVYEDAGTEKLTPDSFRILEDILDAREGNPTIVTTNLSRKQFADRWSTVDGWERLQSRLATYLPVEYSGPDLRLG